MTTDPRDTSKQKVNLETIHSTNDDNETSSRLNKEILSGSKEFFKKSDNNKSGHIDTQESRVDTNPNANRTDNTNRSDIYDNKSSRKNKTDNEEDDFYNGMFK